MPRRPAGVVGVIRGSVVQGPQVPQKALEFDAAAVYAAVAQRARRVVERAGRIAVGSARERAPVRKVFSGGRRGKPARFYSLAEARTELPTYLRGTRPSGTGRGKRGETTKAQALDILRATPIATSRNRANAWQLTKNARQVTQDRSGFHLMDRYQERYLTTRGRYELKLGRAISTGEVYGGRRMFKTQAEVEQFKRATDTGLVGHLGGSLRKSVRLEDRSAGSTIKVSIVAGGEDAPYARFVEFGTRHAAAQPFLRPALKHVEGSFKTMMRDQFRGASK